MTNLRRQFKKKFEVKQDILYTIPGLLGNSTGTVKVPNRNNYVYVRLAGAGVAEVFNNRVQNTFDLPVICGYDPVDPQRFQVLSIQGSTTDAVGGYISTGSGYAPSDRYRWMFPGGGQDPLFVELRQWLPLRITPSGGMKFIVHNQVIWTGTAWMVFGGATETDLTSLIPATAGKCCMVLVSIGSDGLLDTTAGSDVDIADLVVTDIPAPPAGTKYVLGVVRLYNGQTAIQEARTNTDVSDLRFPQISSDDGVGEHEILSAAHTDTDATDTPVEGDVLTYRSNQWVSEDGVDISSNDAEIAGINFLEQAENPTTPATDHRVLFAKSDGIYEIDDAGTAVSLTGKMTNPMTTAGDIIYGGASGVPTRLAAGTEDYVLTMGATNPEWVAAFGSDSSWSVLTNGDPDDPELIFADGDVIIVEILE